MYSIDHLFFIVLELDMGKPPLLTERYGKFIDFWSIIHHFQFETIYLQEFVRECFFVNRQLQKECPLGEMSNKTKQNCV